MFLARAPHPAPQFGPGLRGSPARAFAA